MKRILLAAVLLAFLHPLFAAEVPDADELKTISDEMLTDWNEAMLQGDFTSFYEDDCAKVWQSQITAEKLHEMFEQQFGGQKIDFSGAIKEMEPTFEPKPAISKVGDFDVLMISGYYDTKPSRFSFQLKLIEEEDEWKLVGLAISAKPQDK